MPSWPRAVGQALQAPTEDVFLEQKTPNWLNLAIFAVSIAYVANLTARVSRLERRDGIRPQPATGLLAVLPTIG